MFDSAANETDVREDLVVPFLSELGYKRGTANDIMRELFVSYPKESLGRKKPTDPTLRGRADYVLSVIGAGRWVLEVKSPSEQLDSEVIGQALSYAKHPEVSASYVVTTNGIRLKIHSASQTAMDEPLLECAVECPSSLAFAVTGLLSPKAIRRNCTPPIVGIGAPLAVGFPAEVSIVGGRITYETADFRLDQATPKPFRQMIENELESRMGLLRGYVASVSNGKVYRDQNSRIIANICISMHREEMNVFSHNKGFQERDYICLDSSISTSADVPSVFDIVGDVNIDGAEVVYDVSTSSMVEAGFETNHYYSGTAAGYIKEESFLGSFEIKYRVTVNTPMLPISYYLSTTGRFTVELG